MRNRTRRHLRARIGDDQVRHQRACRTRAGSQCRQGRALVRDRGGWPGKHDPPGPAGRRDRARQPAGFRGDGDRSAECAGSILARPADRRRQGGRAGDVPALPAGTARLDRQGGADQLEDRDGATEGHVTGGLVQILEGNTFVVSDDRGDIEASAVDPTGLFSFDTRFLSRWVLTLNGQRLTALSTDDLQYFQARFFLVPGSGTVYVDSTLSVIREREVADGFHEELRILNHESKPVILDIRIEAAADFADLFEVKDALEKKGSYHTSVSGQSLVLRYRRDTFARETWISATEKAAIDEQ